MKKNQQFTITNTIWPGAVLLVLVAAAVWANITFFNGPPQLVVKSRVLNRQTVPGPDTLTGAGSRFPNTVAQNPLTALTVQESISTVIAHVKPSVVSVTRIGAPQLLPNDGGPDFLMPFSSGNSVTGSGIIIDRNGYVITSFRTVGKDRLVKIKVFSGGHTDYHADVIGVDAKTDLAVLKIRGRGTFPVAVLGNSDLLEVGDFVFAIGNPYGFSSSVTMGIVSSNNRQLTINGINFPDMIQTDAPVNSGNDGGPLVNIKGEIVGINLACLMPDRQFSGIGFAIPINDIMAFIHSNI